MINIMIQSENVYFNKGIGVLLKERFEPQVGESIFCFDHNSAPYADKIDLLIKFFGAGSESVCDAELRSLSPQTVIVGFYNNNPVRGAMNSSLQCLMKTPFIPLQMSVDDLLAIILDVWLKQCAYRLFISQKSCFHCQFLKIKPHEMQVIKYSLQGFSLVRIGNIMNMNFKTVSAHKNRVLRRFSLRGDCELVKFVKAHPHAFKSD
ncbi:hypothetical protein GE278_04230 [Enterobacteriaceae bacterium Kacie_13]|nr:hypothetical protein GE278_04230 [Enterobacteriaceae bacterium Kacie_13]